jgi:hypothetical protein
MKYAVEMNCVIPFQMARADGLDRKDEAACQTNAVSNCVTEEVIVRYTKLYADTDGESHFEDAEFTFNPIDFALLAPPVHIASFGQATQVVFLRAPAGFNAGQHKTTARQLVFVLTGVHEIAASDGEVRQFAPGSVLLAEDTTGKGHLTRIMEDSDTLAAYIQLPG